MTADNVSYYSDPKPYGRNVRSNTSSSFTSINTRNENMGSSYFANLHFPTSKKQRFRDLMHSATSSISQKTAEGIKAVSDSTTQVYDYNIHTKGLENIKIRHLPAYTTFVDGTFETIIRLSTYIPGDPDLKRNKLLISVCKQFLRTGNESLLNSPTKSVSDDSFSSYSPSNSSSSSCSDFSGSEFNIHLDNGSELDIMKHRILGFLDKKIPNVPVVVQLSEISQTSQIDNGKYEMYDCRTDQFGDILLTARTDFLPAEIKVNLSQSFGPSTSGMKTFHNTFIKPGGIGVISDIDDTIKHTGITGDKMSMFRNVFVQAMDNWLIEDMPRFFDTLYNSRKEVDFFYASNSPSQLNDTLSLYINRYYPPGPIFLKQYSGNLLSSIMESGISKKLPIITNIMKNYPKKKFILVGDSGEQDFETYIRTALLFKQQILGIYIRCCKNSISDSPVRENSVLNDLNEIIKSEYYNSRKNTNSKNGRVPPPVPKRKPILSAEQNKKIALSKLSHIPKVNVKLTTPIIRSQEDKLSLHSYTNNSSIAPTRKSELYDKKGDNWKMRVKHGLQLLDDSGDDVSKIKIMFFKDPIDALADVMNMLKEREN